MLHIIKSVILVGALIHMSSMLHRIHHYVPAVTLIVLLSLAAITSIPMKTRELLFLK